MKRMTDFELLKYSMMTTALSAIGILIFEFLLWLCRKMDEEEKENKKNKPKEKEPK